MSEEESITEYIFGVDEVTNEYVIVQNFLRSLPMKFNSKISAIEEMFDLKSLTMH